MRRAILTIVSHDEIFTLTSRAMAQPLIAYQLAWIRLDAQAASLIAVVPASRSK
jgi:hypothetical protein